MKTFLLIVICFLMSLSCTSFEVIDHNTISSELIAKTVKQINSYSYERIVLYPFLAYQDSTFAQFIEMSNCLPVPPRIPSYPLISNLKLDENYFIKIIDVCDVNIIIDFRKRKEDEKWAPLCDGVWVFSNPYFDYEKGIATITEWKIFPVEFERYEIGWHVFIKRDEGWKYGGYNVLFSNQQSIEDHILN